MKMWTLELVCPEQSRSERDLQESSQHNLLLGARRSSCPEWDISASQGRHRRYSPCKTGVVHQTLPCCLFAPCWKLHKLSFFSLLCHKGELFSKSTSSALWFWSKKHQCSAIFYQTSAITPQTTLPTRKPLRILHMAENYSENYNQENFISYGTRCKTQDLNSFWRASSINKRHKHSLTVWFLGGTYKKWYPENASMSSSWTKLGLFWRRCLKPCP